MSSEDFYRNLSDLVEKINGETKIFEDIKEWIGQYDGKIIGFNLPDKKFYLAFDSDRVEMYEGEPASFDIILIGDTETLTDILFSGSKQIRTAVKQGKIGMWGNYHELYKLEEILEKIRKI
ncbi:MAG: SCP2 sterol-binding domain-containing protein [Candidatus Jordarchaeaceae archaeon]